MIEASARAPAPRTAGHPPQRKILLGLLALFLVGLATGGAVLFLRSRIDLPQPGQLGILSASLLKRTLVHRGVPRKQAVDPFPQTGAIMELAAGLKDGPPKERAAALARKVAKVIQGASIDLTGELDSPLRTPAQLLAQLKKEQGKPLTVLSFELAALMTAALRAAGLPAVLGLVHQVDAPMPTADARGSLARYVAVVYPRGGLGKTPLQVLDPARALRLPVWAGKGSDPSMIASPMSLQALDDATAAAHLLALRAFRLRHTASKEAYSLARWALGAAAPSATLQMVQAEVLAAAGGVQDALSEARKALALRKDPPRLCGLAMFLLAAGRPAESLPHLQEALKQDPKYWPARLMSAALLMSAKPEEGAKHLDAALAIAPGSAAVLTFKATLLMRQGKHEQALSLLKQAAKAQPSEERGLALYQVLMMMDKTDEASKVRATLLKASKDAAKTKEKLSAIDKMLKSAAESPPVVAPNPPPPTGGSLLEEDLPGGLSGPSPPQLKLPDVTLGQ